MCVCLFGVQKLWQSVVCVALMSTLDRNVLLLPGCMCQSHCGQRLVGEEGGREEREGRGEGREGRREGGKKGGKGGKKGGSEGGKEEEREKGREVRKK